MFWNSMAPWEKDHIVAAFSFELNQCETPDIRVAALGGLIANIDPDLAARVAENLGIDLAGAIEAAPPPAHVNFADPETMPSGKRSTAGSPALSMDKAADNIMGRKVAILIDAGVDGVKVKAMKAALNAEGAVVHLIAAHGGMVKAADGSMLPVDKAAPNASSVFYDGVIVAGGADAGKMAAMGLVKAFLAETFKFGKTIAALAAAAPVVAAAHLPGVGAKGAPKLGVFIDAEVTDAFMEAMKTPRFRNRDVEAVAA